MSRLERIVAELPEAKRVDIAQWRDHPSFLSSREEVRLLDAEAEHLSVKLSREEAPAVVGTDSATALAGHGLARRGWIDVSVSPRWALSAGKRSGMGAYSLHVGGAKAAGLSAFSSWARCFIAARSSAANPGGPRGGPCFFAAILFAIVQHLLTSDVSQPPDLRCDRRGALRSSGVTGVRSEGHVETSDLSIELKYARACLPRTGGHPDRALPNVLSIHGCHSPFSSRSHHDTERLPSSSSSIFPSSSSRYSKRAGPIIVSRSPSTRPA
jgi:hypothetical protein